MTGVAPGTSLAAEVREALLRSPRQLPTHALYDALGSALFAAICELPWYPLTRAERRLLSASGHDIFAAAGSPTHWIELGCGDGSKLDLLLQSTTRSALVRRIDLVDVSPSALRDAVRRISHGRMVNVVSHAMRYEKGLAVVAAARAPGERMLVLFLGSNVGNFDPPAADEFLAVIGRSLAPGDLLLMGADLRKPERELLLAYDDPLGITAAFNKNLLLHLNAALGATFDIDAYDHRALWNEKESRVEMHLVSRARQRVDVPLAGLSIEIAQGEAIWTESSYKYSVEAVDAMMRKARFSPVERWIDDAGQFVLTLGQVN